ncbi:hypothetical protein F4782DRAFT_518284 [Xylaria castorea]|nr:hypothetical protein F4782DRAFT_518284 [Xylaria castorea]
MYRFSKGQFFNFETARILGMAPYGGAKVAEVIEAVGQIRDRDLVSWAKAWKAQAERAEALTDESFTRPPLSHGPKGLGLHPRSFDLGLQYHVNNHMSG